MAQKFGSQTTAGAKGNITSKTNTSRSYIITTPGGTVHRNWRHLIAVPKALTHGSDNDPTSTHCSENDPHDNENNSDDGDTPRKKEDPRDNMHREQLSEPVTTD